MNRFDGLSDRLLGILPRRWSGLKVLAAGAELISETNLDDVLSAIGDIIRNEGAAGCGREVRHVGLALGVSLRNQTLPEISQEIGACIIVAPLDNQETDTIKKQSLTGEGVRGT